VNANTALRCLTLVCCGLVTTMSVGCARWIELMAAPSTPYEQTAEVIAQEEQVPLIIDRIRTTSNGSPQNPFADTEQRILGSLSEMGLFSHLAASHSAAPAPGTKVIRARIQVDEAIDPHAAGAAWKGIAIGASMYILTPFLPLEYDYATHVSLELERWDGQVKRYESQSAGTARYHLFGATPIMIDELKGHVTENCLTELIRQIVHDTAFYTASSAPIREPGIRTVSVKPRTPPIAGAPSNAIPISASPEP
jgi:hypothetical protein